MIVAGKGRRDGDDAPTGLLRYHVLDGELGDVQEALEVRRDERPEVLGRVVRERLGEELMSQKFQKADTRIL